MNYIHDGYGGVKWHNAAEFDPHDVKRIKAASKPFDALAKIERRAAVKAKTSAYVPLEGDFWQRYLNGEDAESLEVKQFQARRKKLGEDWAKVQSKFTHLL